MKNNMWTGARLDAGRGTAQAIGACMVVVLALLLATPAEAFAHGVTDGDRACIQSITGVFLVRFAYLGAKHMMTAYDHLLFLLGVVFFLYRQRPRALCIAVRGRPFGHAPRGGVR